MLSKNVALLLGHSIGTLGTSVKAVNTLCARNTGRIKFRDQNLKFSCSNCSDLYQAVVKTA